MSENFVQLMYLSSAKPELKQSDLDGIIEASRRNNPSMDITGLLIYADGIFIQVLEGPSEAVHTLYEKIRDDRRHQDVAIIAEYLDQERLFPNWSMAFIQPSFDEITKISNTVEMLNRDDVISMLSGDKSRASDFLRKFAEYLG
ncbi:MAG: BLUF domain-containing protein [Rhodospirillaceae bacterium]